MPNQTQLQRLYWIKHDIALLGLRFPTTAISERTGYANSHVSNMLRGKEPCSTNFINRFYAVFGEELDKARAEKQVIVGLEALPLDEARSQKLKAIASTLVELAAIINKMVLNSQDHNVE